MEKSHIFCIMTVENPISETNQPKEGDFSDEIVRNLATLQTRM